MNTYSNGVDTSSNTVDNYRTEGTFDTEDSYRYVSSYDNFDRNSHDHSDGHSNLDSYTSSNEASHSTEVGQNKYKTMMSGMMTDMIKSTVSTAVDTVMESGSAKVTLWQKLNHLISIVEHNESSSWDIYQCYPAGARSAPAGPKGRKAPKGQSACFGAGCYIEMATSCH